MASAAQSTHSAKISPRNKANVETIRELAKKYKIIGVVDVGGLPAPQFQRIRASLNKTAKVFIVKKNLIELTLKELESSHKGISELVSKASGIVGLVFTNDNPFTLYKTVQRSKSPAPARAGAIAPKDIIVPAGPTGFSPGPIIGELGSFKIKAGINAGKVEIKADSLVAKENDVISPQLAGILTRLGIEPMEVGLNIKAVYEAGVIYGKDVLAVDEEKILADLKGEASRCFALAYGLGYYTSENISLFLGEAGRDALGLGVGIAYPAAETMKRLFSKAYAQMSGLSLSLPEEVRPAGVQVQIAAVPVASETSGANEASQTKEEKKEEVDPAAGLGAFSNIKNGIHLRSNAA